MTTKCEVCEEETPTQVLRTHSVMGGSVKSLVCGECADFAMTDPDMVRWHGGKATVQDLDSMGQKG